MEKSIVSPSILSANFNELGLEIKKIEDGGASWLHFDVMDGHFVNNISFGIPVLKKISHTHHLINDVHIMISDPKKYALEFIKAGADIVTFHYEACQNDKEVFEIIDIIHDNGAKAGLSIKPNTPVEKIFPFLYSIDLVLIMTVEPGFGGQEFINSCLAKIMVLKKHIDLYVHHKVLIEVDGGINEDTAKKCKSVGVDVFVAGSYIFNSPNYEERIKKLIL